MTLKHKLVALVEERRLLSPARLIWGLLAQSRPFKCDWRRSARRFWSSRGLEAGLCGVVWLQNQTKQIFTWAQEEEEENVQDQSQKELV